MLPALIPLALTLAPMLARHLAGAEAAAVTAQVAEAARAVVGTDDAEEVRARLEADPTRRADLAIELARIAAEREAAEHAAQVEALRIAAADRTDARSMARAGGLLGLGALLVTVISALLLTSVLGVLAFTEIPPGNRDVVMMLAGAIAGMATAAFQFWVGSSSGSAGKSGLLGVPFGQGRGERP
jgi:hypothetical protein